MSGLLIIDNRYLDIAKHAWGHKYEVLGSVTCVDLASAVASHPDMVLFPVGERMFICAPNVYGEYIKLLSPFGIKLVQGETELKSNYPDDIAYNILTVGGFAFGKSERIDPKIREYLSKNKIKIENVRQGYAKCSSCVVGSAVITEDLGIYSAVCASGLDGLLIPPGDVLLPGYDYGFFGGATGMTSLGNLLLFGDLTFHRKQKLILDFIKEKNINLSCIKNQPITDVGTIMCAV